MLKSLDDYAMEPSAIGAARRKDLTEMFEGLRDEAGLPASIVLEFRGGGFIGPNAMALPGGTVLVTDELVELMGSDDQLAAVVAHELGHVQQRHTVRMLLQSSVIALVSMAVLGDASSITGLAVTVPTTLVYNGYSRDFEREADRFAYHLLRRTGRRPAELAAALAALHDDYDKWSGDDESNPEAGETAGDGRKTRAGRRRGVDLGYFSTHPNTGERIRTAKEASR